MERAIRSPSIDSLDNGAAATILQRNLIERVCVGDVTTRAAEQYGDRPALIEGERTTTFPRVRPRSKELNTVPRR